ncbi:MAG: prolyl oligopeptidase family serine peptidase [Clostridia bacterium]|nr:prolyl oligopeptidase family serine peptidase [Clostridia bacterium]
MIEARNLDDLRYLIRFPDDYQPGMRCPVLLHIHGAGGRGTDLDRLKEAGAMAEAAKGNPALNPFIVVAPQCTSNSWFDCFERLLAFCEQIYSADYTDRTRFYLSGISMGGYTAYQLMMSRPALFTAAIICCGGGMYWNAARLKSIPLRIFHGMQDTAVYPEESIRMSAAINANGGNAQLCLFSDCKHDCWTRVYADPDHYAWLLTHRKEV